MRKPFNNEFKLTQGFNDPCCRDSYKKFGLMGHNGLDYGLPTGTPVVAPHGGKVIEATLDPQGYGLYLKIENDIEGSVLAHNKELRVGVGDQVSEGQLIAYSNNSGNSTGPHLHWGYYRFPRNRQNGFAGFIDQTPFISQPDDLLKQRADAFVAVADKLQKPVDKDIVLADIDKLLKYESLIVEKDKLLSEKDKQIEEMAKKVDEIDKTAKTLVTENERLSTALQELTRSNERQAEEIDKMKVEIAELQKIQPIEQLSSLELISTAIKRFFGRR